MSNPLDGQYKQSRRQRRYIAHLSPWHQQESDKANTDLHNQKTHSSVAHQVHLRQGHTQLRPEIKCRGSYAEPYQVNHSTVNPVDSALQPPISRNYIIEILKFRVKKIKRQPFI